MDGVHEDQVGSDFYRPNYRRGSIITGDTGLWGVVVKDAARYNPWPLITWLFADGWSDPALILPRGLSAPYVHTYDGIPDEVLAKATAVMLVDTDNEPVTNDSKRRT